MKKCLVTGCSGFVGRYLIDYLLACSEPMQIWGVDLRPPADRQAGRIHFTLLDLFEREKLEAVLVDARPDYIIHLASFSSVADSWRDPIACFKHNTNIFLNVLEIVHVQQLRCRILSIGSSEQYGAAGSAALPLTEQSPLCPASPYAAARVAQEQLSLIYSKGFLLDIVCTRSFNHLGAGQPEKFVASSITRQFARIAKGFQGELSVGNTGVIRDFIDVRDVVRAYALLLSSGVSGEAYNICNGSGISIAGLIDLCRQISGIDPRVRTQKDLLRPIENEIVVGSHEKLTAATGWAPEITVRDSLRDMYEHWLSIM